MSTSPEQMIDDLARDTLALAEATGDTELVGAVSSALATSSTTAQEAFMASIRLRQAVSRGKALLEQRARAAKAAATTPTE